MMNKMFLLYILFVLFSTAGVFSFADEPSSAVDKQVENLRQEVLADRRQRIQERQRPSSLEARREAVRKQLEDGVEAMYQEALSSYKQGDYMAAAEKFKDVQDILSGYQSAGQYMDEALLKSLVPASPSVSRQDAVSKALDLLDPNAQ